MNDQRRQSDSQQSFEDPRDNREELSSGMVSHPDDPGFEARSHSDESQEQYQWTDPMLG